jgi:hypothetical protein
MLGAPPFDASHRWPSNVVPAAHSATGISNELEAEKGPSDGVRALAIYDPSMLSPEPSPRPQQQQQRQTAVQPKNSFFEEYHSSELTSFISDSWRLDGAEHEGGKVSARGGGTSLATPLAAPPEVGVIAGSSFNAGMSNGVIDGAGTSRLEGQSAGMDTAEMQAEAEDAFPEGSGNFIPSAMSKMQSVPDATHRSNHSQLITALLTMATAQPPEPLLGMYELTGELTNQGQTLVAFARTVREPGGEFAIKCAPST